MPGRWQRSGWTGQYRPKLIWLLPMGRTLAVVYCALAALLLHGITLQHHSVDCVSTSLGLHRDLQPVDYSFHHQRQEREKQRYRHPRSLLQANSSETPAPLELHLSSFSDLSTDAQALLALKVAIQADPQQRLNSWGSPPDDPCHWYGVLCSLVTSTSASTPQARVTSLDLAGANLVGLLPPSTFSSLPALVNISLALNSFHGNLSSMDAIVSNSSSSAMCSNLKSLDLSSNLFEGPLPSVIFTAECLELTSLNLSHNNLSGGIPFDAIAPPLQLLDLSNNSLSGGIPSGLFPSAAGASVLQILDLSSNHLTGPMPPLLFANCTTLQVVDLSGNQLTGPIPAGIGKCPELRSLNLSGNPLSSELGSGILLSCSASGSDCAVGAPNLQVLDLSRNNLTGSLAFLQSCPQSLTFLSFSGNHVFNEFPLGSYFSACRVLRTLHVSDNQLSGSLPPGLGAMLPTVQDLDLSTNHFVGALPVSLAQMKSLQSLRVSNNNLTGDLPADLIYSLCEAGLQVLVLSFNYFSGALPEGFLSKCSGLKVLDLSANKMNGTVPADFCPGNMSVAPALEFFAIPNNNISGTIPKGLSRCVHLRTLDLSFNVLEGGIPEELGYLASMEYLFLWSNQLSGNIPPSLGNCTRLKGLVLNYNRLTGYIPHELSKCRDLLWLSLNTNYLEGNIPAEMGLMQKLALLQLGNNSFTGPLPPELANCTGLIWLDVNSNKLSGTIPWPIGRREARSSINPELENFSFAFVKNIGPNCQGIGGLMEFSGIRVTELTTSPRLVSCNFTRLFSGASGNNFYNWRSDSSIEYLDMSFNQLTGPIPDDFGNMDDLHVLNLGHNYLSGPLPAALGNIKQLESLILSFNRLTGPIPASLARLTFLSWLDLSYNNLSGLIPSGGQLATFPASVYANNPGLCGPPLPADTRCSGGSDGGRGGTPLWAAGKRREPLAPWATSLLLAFLISVGLLVVTAVWWVWTGRRLPWKWWKWTKGGHGNGHRGSLECGHDRIPSWNYGGSDWKSGYGREPLSINVATFERPLRRLTFAHLLEATNGFSEESIIGAGGFGEVYKAELPDGGTVAVKKLIHSSFQGDREFTAEMETLGKIKHHNLVPLLGYCKVGEERLLVYEFMACGSLEHILHDRGGSPALALPLPLPQHQNKERPPKKVGNSGLLTPPLRVEFDWELRRQVAMGAARGLAFLHHNCIPHIIHRDMKSSNVLLDRHLVARVSDFGMARLISASDTHLSVSTLAGTPGYVPPEYYQSFRCTTKGDVYSFGVVLLELLTGKRPTNKEEFGDSNLVGWVKLLLAQKRSCDVLDPDLRGNGMEHDMLQHLRIACMCVEDVPSHRPTMLQVVAMFKELHLDTTQVVT